MTTVQPPPSASIDLDRTFLPEAPMRQLSRAWREADGTLRAEMDVSRAHWVYDVHFPGDPVLPGCLMIEAAGQLVAVGAWEHLEGGRPRMARSRAEFHAPVTPCDVPLALRATIRRRLNVFVGDVALTLGARDVATIRITLAVLDPPGV